MSWHMPWEGKIWKGEILKNFYNMSSTKEWRTAFRRLTPEKERKGPQKSWPLPPSRDNKTPRLMTCGSYHNKAICKWNEWNIHNPILAFEVTSQNRDWTRQIPEERGKWREEIYALLGKRRRLIKCSWEMKPHSHILTMRIRRQNGSGINGTS